MRGSVEAGESMALLKLCRCGKKIPLEQPRCEECQVKYDERQKDRHKIYKHNRADAWEQSFYNSKEWKRAKQSAKVRDKGLCLICFSNNTIKAMDTVHHIIELKEDRSKALSDYNLICLCEHHHQLVHKAYETDKKKEVREKLRSLLKK
jgi:5-methylcytosine-specific restriction endonuclease McrA